MKNVACRLTTGVALTIGLSMSTGALADGHMGSLPKSVWAIDDAHRLINVNPAMPAKIQSSVQVTGLEMGDKVIGIDFRVAYGDMYALADTGRIYIINQKTGKATLVPGSSPVAHMAMGPYGFDFNPAADKLRVVGDKNSNSRLHPETGAVVDFNGSTAGVQLDPKLAYSDEDPYAGELPDIVAAAYTYNPNDSKLTTNYAIDRRHGNLVMQGTKEGVTPSVSPNLGVLYTVGDLSLGSIRDASFDISDISNVALAAVLSSQNSKTVLVEIDLESGRNHELGVLGDGVHYTGFAIEP
ncbi:DUF4394 domain-containing protein [Rhodanobacter aciditrophus]|uniref:DUF4394 domain-containing protein n=1 Tax=Rhodanobacter aciditrophus TaxID=1623218 RepID=A0ABW4AWU9_9GAMM